MHKQLEEYKQQLFETAAEYGKAGRSAYQELEVHIDEALEHNAKPAKIMQELGEPEQAIRKILRADGKATYPLHKIITTGVLIAIGLGFLAALSGLLMPLGSKIGGMDAISGDPTANLPYTAERCADFLRLVPTAPDCRDAARLHHYYELTDQRLTLTVLCALSLLAFFIAIRRGWVHILPRKTVLLLACSIYIAIGGLTMLLALGNLSAGRTWQWLGDFITGVPIFVAGVLILAYYLGYITKPAHKK